MWIWIFEYIGKLKGDVNIVWLVGCLSWLGGGLGREGGSGGREELFEEVVV